MTITKTNNTFIIKDSFGDYRL